LTACTRSLMRAAAHRAPCTTCSMSSSRCATACSREPALSAGRRAPYLRRCCHLRRRPRRLRQALSRMPSCLPSRQTAAKRFMLAWLRAFAHDGTAPTPTRASLLVSRDFVLMKCVLSGTFAARQQPTCHIVGRRRHCHCAAVTPWWAVAVRCAATRDCACPSQCRTTAACRSFSDRPSRLGAWRTRYRRGHIGGGLCTGIDAPLHK